MEATNEHALNAILLHTIPSQFYLNLPTFFKYSVRPLLEMYELLLNRMPIKNFRTDYNYTST